MSTDEQVSNVNDELVWQIDPAIGELVKALKNALETEHARLREQYDRAEAADQAGESFDLEMNIYYWLDDMKELVDQMDGFDVTPEPADEPAPQSQETFHAQRAVLARIEQRRNES